MHVPTRFWDGDKNDAVDLISASIDASNPDARQYEIQFLVKDEGDDGFDAAEQERRWQILNHPGWIELETGDIVCVHASVGYVEGIRAPDSGCDDSKVYLGSLFT
jgi:hypothetical protein